jgi:hypothetical protein
MFTRRLVKTRKTVLTAGVILLFGAAVNPQGAWSADGPPSTDADASTSASQPAATETTSPQDDFAQLKALIEAQSEELQKLSLELKQQEAKTQALEEEIGAHGSATSVQAVTAQPAVSAAAALGPVVGISPTAAANSDPLVPQGSQQDSQPQRPINIVSPENPLSIKIGSAELTPGGFVDLTGIFRSADVGSGLGTNFTILPYNNTLPLGRLSEFRFTGQGSRLSLRVDAQPGKSTGVTGYFESDFNGFEPANSNISTKSDTFRLRLAFVQVRHGKWELVTGQTWSLLTPTRQGLSPFPENVFTALRLDTSYLAGLVYSRQPSIRLVYHPTSWWALAVALENPQQFVPSSVVFPTDGSTNFFSQQFDNGSSSTSAASSAVNPTVPNLHPDIEAKTAIDWRIDGKLFHIDAGGVARTFKVFDNLVTPNAARSITGGGGGFNTNLELVKNFHVITNTFYGDGMGRYIGGLGPDVIVKPDGSLSAVHAGSAIGGFEWQTTPRFLVDGYYSGAYFWRNYRVTTSSLGSACSAGTGTDCVGFGYPGSANTNNRDYQEASLGFIPTIFSSPNFGKLQVVTQFSWVVRTPWYVAPGNPKNAHAFISYVNLRYLIP